MIVTTWPPHTRRVCPAPISKFHGPSPSQAATGNDDPTRRRNCVLKYTRKIIETPEGTQLLKIKIKSENFGVVEKEPSLGGKPQGARTLECRIVAVEVNPSVVAVGVGYTGRGIMLDGGGGRETIRERHRIVRWVQVPGGKRWGHGRIFIAAPRVLDDRELMRKLSGFCVGRKHRREELVSFGEVRWWMNMAEMDVCGWEMI